MNWVSKLFHKEQKIVYEIKETKIQMPKDDEVIIFQIPNATKEVLNEFDRCLIEFQNSNRKFITVGGRIEILTQKAKKQNLEVKNGESNKTE